MFYNIQYIRCVSSIEPPPTDEDNQNHRLGGVSYGGWGIRKKAVLRACHRVCTYAGTAVNYTLPSYTGGRCAR